MENKGHWDESKSTHLGSTLAAGLGELALSYPKRSLISKIAKVQIALQPC